MNKERITVSKKRAFTVQKKTTGSDGLTHSFIHTYHQSSVAIMDFV
jgi:hypothetical protein